MSLNSEKIKLALYPHLTHVLHRIFSIFELEDKVFFSAYRGERYGDNPKYISEKMHEMYPQYKLIWAMRGDYSLKEIPEYVKVVKWGSLKMMYEMFTSKVWVDSHTKPLWVEKRESQYYIETWHGGLGFKKIEGDAEEKLSNLTIETIKHNSKMVDLLISNSSWLTEIYKRAFWYSGEILECGYPKADCIFHQNDKLMVSVKSKLGLPKHAKIILYAPTFRRMKGISCYQMDFEKVRKEFEKKLGEECYFVIRLHPFVEKYSKDICNYSKYIINGTDYPDMQELTIVSDVFITDYSSGIFDFALTYRPGFLYARDLGEYEKERGLYMDLRRMPFPFASNTEELIDNIMKFEYNMYERDLKEYLKKVGLKESGHAAEDICIRINEIIKTKGNL